MSAKPSYSADLVRKKLAKLDVMVKDLVANDFAGNETQARTSKAFKKLMSKRKEYLTMIEEQEAKEKPSKPPTNGSSKTNGKLSTIGAPSSPPAKQKVSQTPMSAPSPPSSAAGTPTYSTDVLQRKMAKLKKMMQGVKPNSKEYERLLSKQEEYMSAMAQEEEKKAEEDKDKFAIAAPPPPITSAPPATSSTSKNPSYKVLLKKLEKVDAMMEGKAPGSKQYKQLEKKREEYKTALAEITQQDDQDVETLKAKQQEEEQKRQAEEKARKQQQLQEEEQQRRQLMLKEEEERKRKQQEEEARARLAQEQAGAAASAAAETKSEYSYKQLTKKLEKAEAMMEGKAPGTKQYKQLKKKKDEYIAAIQETPEYKAMKQEEAAKLKAKQDAEGEQQRREEAEKQERERIRQEEARKLQEQQQKQEEKKSEYSYSQLVKKLEKVEAMIQGKSPGTKQYKQLEKKREDYMAQIEQTPEYQQLQEQQKQEEERQRKLAQEQQEREERKAEERRRMEQQKRQEEERRLNEEREAKERELLEEQKRREEEERQRQEEEDEGEGDSDDEDNDSDDEDSESDDEDSDSDDEDSDSDDEVVEEGDQSFHQLVRKLQQYEAILAEAELGSDEYQQLEEQRDVFLYTIQQTDEYQAMVQEHGEDAAAEAIEVMVQPESSGGESSDEEEDDDGTSSQKEGAEGEYSYKNMVIALGKIERMLQATDPNSEQHKRLEDKKELFLDAIQETDEYKKMMQEKEAAQRRRGDDTDDEDDERTDDEDIEPEEPRVYTYKQLLNALEKVQNMLHVQTPGSHQHRQLEDKRDMYLSAIQQTDEYTLMMERGEENVVTVALKAQAERQRKQKEQRQHDSDDSDEEEDDYSYIKLATALAKIEKMLQVADPDSEQYEQLMENKELFLSAIQETEEYQAMMKQKQEKQNLLAAAKQQDERLREEAQRRSEKLEDFALPDLPYKQLVTSLEKVERMLQVQSPGSHQHRQLEEKRNRYLVAIQKKAEFEQQSSPLNLEKKRLQEDEAASEQATDKSVTAISEAGNEQPQYSYSVLKKKLQKLEEMLENAAETKGPNSSYFQKLERKRMEYIAAIQATEEGKQEFKQEKQSRAEEDEIKRREYEEQALELQRQRQPFEDEAKALQKKIDTESKTEKEQQTEPRQQYSYDLLVKKMQKLEQMQTDILNEKGETGRNGKKFKNLEKKRLEYIAALEQTDEWKAKTQEEEDATKRIEQERQKELADAENRAAAEKARLEQEEKVRRERAEAQAAAEKVRFEEEQKQTKAEADAQAQIEPLQQEMAKEPAKQSVANASPESAQPQYSFSMLQKKLQKAQQMQQEILDAKGEMEGRNSKKFKNLEQKRLDYIAALEQFEEWQAESRGDSNDAEEDSAEADQGEHAAILQDAKAEVESLKQAQSDELEALQEKARLLTLQRSEAEAAADYATANNQALGPSSHHHPDESSYGDATEDQQHVSSTPAQPQYSYTMLKKKLHKLDQMQKSILESKGETDGRAHKNFKKLEDKRLEYIAALEQTEEYKQQVAANKEAERARLDAEARLQRLEQEERERRARAEAEAARQAKIEQEEIERQARAEEEAAEQARLEAARLAEGETENAASRRLKILEARVKAKRELEETRELERQLKEQIAAAEAEVMREKFLGEMEAKSHEQSKALIGKLSMSVQNMSDDSSYDEDEFLEIVEEELNDSDDDEEYWEEEVVHTEDEFEEVVTDGDEGFQTEEEYFSEEEEFLTDHEDHNADSLRSELEAIKRKQMIFQKQLLRNNSVIPQEIPHDVAKSKIAEISHKMNSLQAEYSRLEKERYKYSDSLIQTEEWANEQLALERRWGPDEVAENKKALRKIRRHMPVNIRNTNLDTQSKTISNGNGLPKEMMQRFLKINVLQLLRVDWDEIERMHPSVLEGLTTSGLTLTEHRALYEHLKDVATSWQVMKEDQLAKRKLLWHGSLTKEFNEILTTYKHHIEEYGPPDGHLCTCSNESNAKKCATLEDKCPIKADNAVNYDGDYGYPQDAVFEPSHAKVWSQNETFSTSSMTSRILKHKKDAEDIRIGICQRLDIMEPLSEKSQNLLRDVVRAETQVDSLRQQLVMEDVAFVDEAIPYEDAKLKVEEKMAAIRELSVRMTTETDVAVKAKLQDEYSCLARDLEKYTTAMTLTPEWDKKQEQKNRERAEEAAAII